MRAARKIKTFIGSPIDQHLHAIDIQPVWTLDANLKLDRTRGRKQVFARTYVVVDGAILLVWGWLGVRSATAMKRFLFGLVNKVCGSLMIAAAALLATKDFQPEP